MARSVADKVALRSFLGCGAILRPRGPPDSGSRSAGVPWSFLRPDRLSKLIASVCPQLRVRHAYLASQLVLLVADNQRDAPPAPAVGSRRPDRVP